MRIGVFGGTFDPPHVGHTAIATAARDQLGLDIVEMIPAYVPPHRSAARASAAERLAMVAIACRGRERVLASRREISRRGVSYTIDTLLEIGAEEPHAELFLIIGGDSYVDLPKWQDYERVVATAHLAVVWRPGRFGRETLRTADQGRVRPLGETPPSTAKAIYTIECPPLPVAARGIRESLRRGTTAIAELDPDVLNFIREHHLYGVPA